jgi:hypothetical protein
MGGRRLSASTPPPGRELKAANPKALPLLERSLNRRCELLRFVSADTETSASDHIDPVTLIIVAFSSRIVAFSSR